MISGAVILWPAAALLGLVGLALVAPRDVPKISGTVAFILTIAALAVAIRH